MDDVRIILVLCTPGSFNKWSCFHRFLWNSVSYMVCAIAIFPPPQDQKVAFFRLPSAACVELSQHIEGIQREMGSEMFRYYAEFPSSECYSDSDETNLDDDL